MKNVSTGFGLCVLGLGIAAWPVLDRLVPTANASAVTAAAAAVSTAATAQGAPTIVWYQSFARPYNSHYQSAEYGRQFWVVRAWSDGKLEARLVDVSGSNLSSCNPTNTPNPCSSPWMVINDPAEGLTFNADLNFDEAVDGADLGMLLAKWGPAPRNPVPPSDCPLGLIN